MPVHIHRSASSTPTSRLPWPREANNIITTTPVKLISAQTPSPLASQDRKRPKKMNIKTISTDRQIPRGRSVSSSSRIGDSRFQQQHDQMMSRQQFRTNTSNNSRGSSHRHTRDGSMGKRSSANSVQGTESYESGYSQMSRKSEHAPSKFIEVKGENNHQRVINGVKDVIEGMFPFLLPIFLPA